MERRYEIEEVRERGERMKLEESNERRDMR